MSNKKARTSADTANKKRTKRSSSKTVTQVPSASTKAAETKRPSLEVIACMANCAGSCKDSMEFNFDLRDNRTGFVYRNLVATKDEGEWSVRFPSSLHTSMKTDLPQLSSVGALNSKVKVDDTTMDEIEEAIIIELERWSRNLFALAEVAADQDSGFKEYRKAFTARVKEYDSLIDYSLFGDQDVPREALDKFAKWPLRV